MYKLLAILLLLCAVSVQAATVITGGVLAASDTTGTNARPSSAFILTGTNAALSGVLNADGGAFTNSLTLNGTTVSTFTGTSGTMINSGTPSAGNVPTYSNTTGTNLAPSSALTITGTNASLTGNLSANGGIFTNTLTLNGTSVSTASAANPTASVGLSAVNGAATTFLRSDGAPALSQSITPTWTGQHIFASTGSASAPNIAIGSAANYGFYRTGNSLASTFNGTLGWYSDISQFHLNTQNISWGDDTFIARESIGVLQMGTDAATTTAQTLKSHDGSGTDKDGANFTRSGGQSTGTGRGGALIGKTSPSSTTGSSANAYSERYHYPAKAVTLTEASATTVVTIACASSKFVGGQCVVTINADDGTDFQCRTLRFTFSAVNKGGTVTAGIDTPDESVAVSTGTLTATITAVANGNAVDLKVNATSSLTQTTLSAIVALLNLNSNGTAAVTEI